MLLAAGVACAVGSCRLRATRNVLPIHVYSDGTCEALGHTMPLEQLRGYLGKQQAANPRMDLLSAHVWLPWDADAEECERLRGTLARELGRLRLGSTLTFGQAPNPYASFFRGLLPWLIAALAVAAGVYYLKRRRVRRGAQARRR